MHILYAMKSADKAPAAGGDMKSWFLYYKFDVDDEVYVPVVPTEQVVIDSEDMKKTETYSGFVNAGEGDHIWFAMDGVLLGYAKILRVIEDMINSRHEVWYDAGKAVRFPDAHVEDVRPALVPYATGRILEDEKAKHWMSLCTGGSLHGYEDHRPTHPDHPSAVPGSTWILLGGASEHAAREELAARPDGAVRSRDWPVEVRAQLQHRQREAHRG